MNSKRKLIILFHQSFCLLVVGVMLIGAIMALTREVLVLHHTAFGMLLLLGSFAWFKLLYDSQEHRTHSLPQASALSVESNHSSTPKEPTMALKDYPEGTRIKIGDRRFIRAATSTCWREEHEIPGNRTTRPSVSLENIERMTGLQHVVIEPQGC